MTLSIRLDPELEAELARAAVQSGRSKSELVKAGLREYLAHMVPRKTPYELGKDLFGGPIDGFTEAAEQRKEHLPGTAGFFGKETSSVSLWSVCAQRTIADSGPLAALFDPADRHHAAARAFIEGYGGMLLTTWPALAEVGHLLGHSVDRQLAFLQWVERGGVEIVAPGAGAVARIRQMIDKCRDLPMDLADGSLIVFAIESGVRDLFTFDRGFDACRLPDSSCFNNVLAPI